MLKLLTVGLIIVVSAQTMASGHTTDKLTGCEEGAFARRYTILRQASAFKKDLAQDLSDVRSSNSAAANTIAGSFYLMAATQGQLRATKLESAANKMIINKILGSSEIKAMVKLCEKNWDVRSYIVGR